VAEESTTFGTLNVPETGLIAMRLASEYGSVDEFAKTLERAIARATPGGATLVARLDLGDLSIHIPRIDGPAWNVVPLLHLHAGQLPSEDDWAGASAILEKLERYR